MPESKITRPSSRRAVVPKKPKSKPAAKAAPVRKPDWLMSTPATLYSLEACHTSSIGTEQLIVLTQDEFNALKEHLWHLRGTELSAKEAAPWLNGITVVSEGKIRHLELDKQQADRFFWYAGMASEADSVADRPFTQEEISDRSRRGETVKEHAITIQAYLSMMAKLDERQLAYILAFVDLLEYGDSWMREVICDLLLQVQFSGPGKALEINPRDILADVAYDLFDWWDNIDTARSHAAQHPSLFPPPAKPEPPAAAEVSQPIRKGTTGHSRARKAERKAATHG